MRQLLILIALFLVGCAPATEGKITEKYRKIREINGQLVQDYYVRIENRNSKRATEYQVSEQIYNQLNHGDYFVPEPKAEEQQKNVK